MFVSRRRFLLLGVLGTFLGFAGRVLGQRTSVRAFDRDLRAWLEVLIPSDAISPGAGALQLELELIQVAQLKPKGSSLLLAGIYWAQQEASVLGADSFSQLSSAQAETVVAKAAAAERGTVARSFFEYSFGETKRLYYAKPESWRGLGITRPPQPMGYMDYGEKLD
jgi:hypothetical protein